MGAASPTHALIAFARNMVQLDPAFSPFMREPPPDSPLLRYMRVATGRANEADLRETWIEWITTHDPQPGTPQDG
jgi:hypothetical protein